MSDRRASEAHGWKQIGLMCSAGRRSLWFRVTHGEKLPNPTVKDFDLASIKDGDMSGDFYPIVKLELCAGREGDDSYVEITKDNPQFEQLLDVILTAEFAANS